MEEKQWAGTTYGNKWMHKWLIRILGIIHVKFLYAFTAIFVIPIVLIINPSYGITYNFFKRRFSFSSIKAFWYTYLNHCMMGQAVIDKFAMYAGKKFEVETIGYEQFTQRASKEEGFVQLSSHIGNYEIAGYTLIAEKKRFNALVFAGEKETIMQNRNHMFQNTNINMIAIKEDMSHLFEIDNALNKGETVSIPADRINGSKKSIKVDFLGSKASFPLGPFSVATARGLDVLSVNVMKCNSTKYKIYITPLEYDKTQTRKIQIEQLAKAYVSQLEKMVKSYPTQWYNYFDFWQ